MNDHRPAEAARYNMQHGAYGTRLVEWRDAARSRDVPVKIYEPAQSRGIVVVSHGIGEDRESYAYLGRALAENGFTAVHITHAGTDRATLERGYLHLYRATKDKQNWVNRPLDVTFVLDKLEARGPVAVVGHSAGAFTAFAVGGMRAAGGEVLRDQRVAVIVPMSMPRMDGVVAAGGYDDIRIPALNVTGTCDTSLIYRTFPRHRRIPFDQTRATGHYLATLRGVTHNSFSNREDENHDAIAALVLMFLDAHLTGNDSAKQWFDTAGRTEIESKELTIERK
jgi:pimeloyl-ACP methyl ester carboxylesterase